MGFDAAGKTHRKERPAQTQVGLAEDSAPRRGILAGRFSQRQPWLAA